MCQALPAAGPDVNIITLLMQGPRYGLAFGETKVCEFLNSKKVLYAVVFCKEYTEDKPGIHTRARGHWLVYTRGHWLCKSLVLGDSMVLMSK